MIHKIGSGSFGAVYKGKNIRTNELVAIKVEPNNCKTKILKNEAKIYQFLGNEVGFPQIKCLKSLHNFLVGINDEWTVDNNIKNEYKFKYFISNSNTILV